MESKQEVKESKRIRPLMALGLLIVATCGLVGWIVYQQQKVSDLNKKIVVLEKNQLPSRIFETYDECISNGGVILNTINAQFNGCLGGNEDETGDLPQHQAFLQYSSQNLPRISERKKSDVVNRVDNADSSSPDLVAFLKQDYAGCEIGSPDDSAKGYYKIIKEVEDRYALLNYGCEDDQAALSGKYYIIAIKLGDGWSLLSPTNNMSEEGQPSCLLVDMFKISKNLSAKCYENSGYNNGDLKDVVYP
jgi:hypothetical protein